MARVAAYCRVSTDKSDQANSFESQKLYFREYIASHTGWTFCGIYADEGVTGTSTKDREGFNRMMDDAEAGLIDLIITKEVSRFSRNILDAIGWTRRLKSRGVGVIFLNDGISTLDPDAELRLSIMASVAQEESRKTSERVKWGQQRKMERGIVFGRSLLGYDVKEGKISINPEGANTVRLIFSKFLSDGMGVRAIANYLSKAGVVTFNGNSVWSGATILKILRNEKYCGDLIQRKTVTPDYLTHKKKYNRGEVAFIVLRDHHAPIIDREEWERAQAELKRRASSSGSAAHGNRYTLSGKIYCASCGKPFLCRTRKSKEGLSYRVWRGSCKCFGSLRERDIEDAVRKLFKSHDFGENISRKLSLKIYRSLGYPDGSNNTDKRILSIKNKMQKLLDAYLEGDVDRQSYLEASSRYGEKAEHLLANKEDARPETKQEAFENIINSLLSGSDDDGAFYLGMIDRVEAVPYRKLQIKLKGSENACTFEI